MSRTATPVGGTSALGTLPRAAGQATNPPQFQSGLSAAFTPASSEEKTDLGALGGADEHMFSLASVDGAAIADDDARPSIPFTPPPEEPSAAKPAKSAKPAKPEKPERPRDVPLNMFAPPDAEDADQKVELAADEIDYRARKSIPPVNEVAAPPPAMRVSSPSIPPATRVANAPSATTSASGNPALAILAEPRVRMVAGVVLAILLGFIPAHLVAASREKSAFAEIDAEIVERQQMATTLEEMGALDGYRASELDHKKSERRNIALASMLIERRRRDRARLRVVSQGPLGPDSTSSRPRRATSPQRAFVAGVRAQKLNRQAPRRQGLAQPAIAWHELQPLRAIFSAWRLGALAVQHPRARSAEAQP